MAEIKVETILNGSLDSILSTHPIAEILCVKNGRAIVVCGFLISTQIWLDWLCYLAGNSQMAPTIFFKLSVHFLKIISLGTHNPPPIFDAKYFSFRWCDLRLEFYNWKFILKIFC